MSRAVKPTPTREASLAVSIFGWAFTPRAGLLTLGVISALGALLVVGEYIQPRAGLRMPFEEQPGFYAAVGAGAVASVLLVAAALRWLLVHADPYAEKPAPAASVNEKEGRDDDHA
jgi:hypothetical protein